MTHPPHSAQPPLAGGDCQLGLGPSRAVSRGQGSHPSARFVPVSVNWICFNFSAASAHHEHTDRSTGDQPIQSVRCECRSAGARGLALDAIPLHNVRSNLR